MPNLRELENALPVGPLKIIALNSAEKLGRNVNDYLVTFRRNMRKTVHDDPAFRGYIENNYLVDASCPVSAVGKARVNYTNPSAVPTSIFWSMSATIA